VTSEYYKNLANSLRAQLAAVTDRRKRRTMAPEIRHCEERFQAKIKASDSTHLDLDFWLLHTINDHNHK